MREFKEYLEAVRSKYAAQPDRLRRRMASFQRESMHEPLVPGEWTPHQVLAHMVAAQRLALAPRLKRILEEDEPDLPNWDEKAWMREAYTGNEQEDGLLDEFERLHRDILEMLEDLPLKAWNRSGHHPLRGRRTLLWWFEYTLAHNEEHLQQLARG